MQQTHGYGVGRTACALAISGLALMACRGAERGGGDGYADRVAAAIPKIEQATGLKFKRPPVLEVRTRPQVEQFLIAKLQEPGARAQLQGEEAAYKALGLLPDTLDLERFLVSLLTEQVAGYYDPATKKLYVVEQKEDQLIGVTITHELVHALQDQYVNLDSIQRATEDTDRQAAAQAVIEGQATYEQMTIMMGGERSLAARVPGGWERMRELIRENQGSMPVFATAPLVIQESLLFPYLSGAEYARRQKTRGQGSTLLTELPTSTEQILHTRASSDSARDEPVAVRFPTAAGAAGWENTLGEFGTRLVLYHHLRDQNAALRGAMGWDGDRYRVLQGGGIVWATAWDSSVDAAEFADVLGDAVRKRYDVGDPAPGADGARTFRVNGRFVRISAGEVAGVPLVLYEDLPGTAGSGVRIGAVTVAK